MCVGCVSGVLEETLTHTLTLTLIRTTPSVLLHASLTEVPPTWPPNSHSLSLNTTTAAERREEKAAEEVAIDHDMPLSSERRTSVRGACEDGECE